MFSKVITGLLVAGAGSLVVSFGLSETCSSEVIEKIVPFIGTLPGLAYSWWARVSMGDITKAGFRK